jgi:catechol 2,3-dioxygenase-like lactoylglutathione lyase family enzyme
MNIKAKAIRPFIGSKNFEISRNFYRDLGFEEVVLFHNMSLFTIGNFAFYLQDAYVKDWVDNTMVFMEVEDLDQFWKDLDLLNLPAKYKGVRTVSIQRMDWGSECFVHDPSGILWHFGVFSK